MRRLEIDKAEVAVAVVCLLIYVAAPFVAMSGAWFDVRFVAMAWLLLFACLAPRFEGVTGRLAIAVTFGLLALKLGSIGLAWSRAQPEIAQVRAVLACVPSLSRVLSYEDARVFECSNMANSLDCGHPSLQPPGRPRLDRPWSFLAFDVHKKRTATNSRPPTL